MVVPRVRAEHELAVGAKVGEAADRKIGVGVVGCREDRDEPWKVVVLGLGGDVKARLLLVPAQDAEHIVAR